MNYPKDIKAFYMRVNDDSRTVAGRAPDRAPRRHPRELQLHELEIVLDRVKVAAGLIDLAQGEGDLVWHADVVPEDGCATVNVGAFRCFSPIERS